MRKISVPVLLITLLGIWMAVSTAAVLASRWP